MRLVFAIDGLKKGGAQRVFSNLTDYMANQNDEVYLILLNKTNVEYYINQNVKIIYVDEREIKKNKIIKFFKLIQYKKILAKILEEIKPDVILSFLPRMNFISLWANNRKYPIIVSSRNDHSIEFPSKFHEILMKWLYPKTTGFIFQTKEQKEYFTNKTCT